MQHRYIITSIDYFTRWVEAVPLRQVNTNKVIKFLEQNIISRFGIPSNLVFDNASYFSYYELTQFSLEICIKIRYSKNYYPQGNGLDESTKKNLIQILKRTITEHHKNWHKWLTNALWVDCVTPKESLRTSPFFLTYGFKAILPPHIFLPSMQLSQSIQDHPIDNIQRIINTLLKLEEERERVEGKFYLHQQRIKWWFDKTKAGSEEF